ncbi:hypothetical protein [uncultured Abyssibacter sp.]|uniref:c-type cytochrome n=1 Tax=uncultured Abyssibacter sp. TaxID=2320202 RepID=UPI0032B29DAB
MKSTNGIVVAAALLLAACGMGGDYDGDVAGGSDNAGGGAAPADCSELFASRVQPRMDYCRTCHVPGGVGDVPDGERFMLSGDQTEDFDHLMASWERIGSLSADQSLILQMASGTADRAHSGGSPWPQGSAAYDDAAALIASFSSGGSCAAGGGEPGGGETLALLGSKRGGHLWFDFCEGQPDGTVLPADPRSLVQDGVSDDKAVMFNVTWKDCRAYPDLVNEAPHPETCGDLRQRWEKGRALMEGNGQITSGSFFAGNDHSNPLLGISASDYNQLWRLWGFTQRPDNFDRLVSERYGMPIGQTPNPYPVNDEEADDPANPGSGQLPAFMTQFRDPDGSWTGRLGFTCHACHTGAAGLPDEGDGLGLLYGSGNSLHDIALMSREIGEIALSPGILFSLFGTSRGTNNASDVNIFFGITQDSYIERFSGLEDFAHFAGVLTSGSTASGDTPAWWNMGHRPLKFQDGFFAGDAARVDLIFYMPLGSENAEDWMRDQAPASDIWMRSLKAPVYPLEIDEALARQGAILFHTKDLWADAGEDFPPRPEAGNGSCASCHGAYSPQFSHDQQFLADPVMEGIAAYIAPHDVIGTDRARADTNNDSVNEFGSSSFLGYPETVGTDQDCGPQNRPELRGDRPYGYLTPPLYGVWATAPYLHNGSVPNVRSLLKPDERPNMWKRVSTPTPAGQEGPLINQAVMGYDVSMERAFDAQRLGWKYEDVACLTDTVNPPLLACNPITDGASPLQVVFDQLYGNVVLVWNLAQVGVFAQVTPQQVEDRKTYNTNLYSQGNAGHEFGKNLTDQEVSAIIEYLKTL